jgi:hypothetical protein
MLTVNTLSSNQLYFILLQIYTLMSAMGNSTEKKEKWQKLPTHNGTNAHHIAAVQYVVWQQGKGWITLVSHSTVDYTTRQ